MHVNVKAIIQKHTASGIEIVLQTRNKPHEGTAALELPGGRVEEYEPLLNALCREVREETGLTLTRIEGVDTRVLAKTGESKVECLQAFAVYQTLQGPVDSMGIYFLCTAEGNLAESGDDTLAPRWVPVNLIEDWMKQNPGQFDWVSQAGLLFYLNAR